MSRCYGGTNRLYGFVDLRQIRNFSYLKITVKSLDSNSNSNFQVKLLCAKNIIVFQINQEISNILENYLRLVKNLYFKDFIAFGLHLRLIFF